MSSRCSYALGILGVLALILGLVGFEYHVPVLSWPIRMPVTLISVGLLLVIAAPIHLALAEEKSTPGE
jgi:hypothetical protein